MFCFLFDPRLSASYWRHSVWKTMRSFLFCIFPSSRLLFLFQVHVDDGVVVNFSGLWRDAKSDQTYAVPSAGKQAGTRQAGKQIGIQYMKWRSFCPTCTPQHLCKNKFPTVLCVPWRVPCNKYIFVSNSHSARQMHINVSSFIFFHLPFETLNTSHKKIPFSFCCLTWLECNA